MEVEELEVYNRLCGLATEEKLNYFLEEYNICGRMLTNLGRSLSQEIKK